MTDAEKVYSDIYHAAIKPLQEESARYGEGARDTHILKYGALLHTAITDLVRERDRWKSAYDAADRAAQRMDDAIQEACGIIELGDQRLLASDGPAGNQPPQLSLDEWRRIYVVLDASRGVHPAGTATREEGWTAETVCVCGHIEAAHTSDGCLVVLSAGRSMELDDEFCPCEQFRERSERPQDVQSGVHTPAPTPLSPESEALLKQGLEDAKAGRIVDLGSFAQYADDDADGSPTPAQQVPNDG